MDSLFYILYIIITALDINNIYLSFIINSLLYILTSLNNYIFIYGHRLVLDMVNKEDEEEKFKGKNICNYKYSSSSLSNNSNKKSRSIPIESENLFNRFLRYHFQFSYNVNNATEVVNVSSKYNTINYFLFKLKLLF